MKPLVCVWTRLRCSRWHTWNWDFPIKSPTSVGFSPPPLLPLFPSPSLPLTLPHFSPPLFLQGSLTLWSHPLARPPTLILFHIPFMLPWASCLLFLVFLKHTPWCSHSFTQQIFAERVVRQGRAGDIMRNILLRWGQKNKTASKGRMVRREVSRLQDGSDFIGHGEAFGLYSKCRGSHRIVLSEGLTPSDF